MTIPRFAGIVFGGVVLWIVALSLPPCLLFYLDFGPLVINIIIVLFIVYFICVPLILVMLLIIDLIMRSFTIVNQDWYLPLSVFAILSILSFLLMYNSLSEHHVFDPVWSSRPA